MVMPYIPGENLYQLLKTKKRMNEELIKFYSAQVVDVIGYLHKYNIIHRNIKLENILLDGNGYIKLLGLGLSKHQKEDT